MAIVAGEAKAGFQLLFLAMPQVKAGRVKAYAVTSHRRFSGAPEIPTMAEGGIVAFETTYWFGILAPARTSPAIIARLNQGIGQVLQISDVRSVLLEQGAEPAPGSPESFRDFIASETVRFRKVIELAGIRAE
jgi:tripartite-type tricarboxylate transporter receptor subunit TctC